MAVCAIETKIGLTVGMVSEAIGDVQRAKEAMFKIHESSDVKYQNTISINTYVTSN